MILLAKVKARVLATVSADIMLTAKKTTVIIVIVTAITINTNNNIAATNITSINIDKVRLSLIN